MRSQLERADHTAALPRLGGMARPNGVVIVSERFWAFAGTKGELIEGRMPVVPGPLRRVPLLRGIARLGLSLSPLMRRGGATRRFERLGLVMALALPFGLVFLSERAALFVGIALTIGLLSLLFRGRTLVLHGAEH